MKRYADINGDSGVVAYEIDDGSITVQFEGTIQLYTYSYASAGQSHIETMKKLAAQGDGLNAYINNNVKFKYVR